MPFTDRVIAILVYLRFQLPHKALAELYRVDRSTVTPAIHEIRPLLAARGFAVLGSPASGCAPWPTCSPTPPPAASPSA
ncbi:MAG: helix-turn-helix domain-containing protein [Streptosporangiaceae bacterium]